MSDGWRVVYACIRFATIHPIPSYRPFTSLQIDGRIDYSALHEKCVHKGTIIIRIKLIVSQPSGQMLEHTVNRLPLHNNALLMWQWMVDVCDFQWEAIDASLMCAFSYKYNVK